MERQLSQNEQFRKLLLDLMYLLQHSYYRGEDSAMVEISKQFVKQMKDDFDARLMAEAKAATEAASKPKSVEPDKPLESAQA